MSKFVLKGVKSQLVSPTKITAVVTEGVGKKAAVKKLTKIQIEVHVGGDEADDSGQRALSETIDAIWPGASIMINKTAGEDVPGWELTSHQRMVEMSVTLCGDADGKEVIVRNAMAVCKSKPKLRSTETGIGKFIIRFELKVDRATLLKVVSFAGGSEIFTWMEPAQLEMSEVVDIKSKKSEKMSMMA